MVPVVGSRGESHDPVAEVPPNGEGKVDLVGGQGDVGVQREDGVGRDLEKNCLIYFLIFYVRRRYQTSQQALICGLNIFQK